MATSSGSETAAASTAATKPATVFGRQLPAEQAGGDYAVGKIDIGGTLSEGVTTETGIEQFQIAREGNRLALIRTVRPRPGKGAEDTTVVSNDKTNQPASPPPPPIISPLKPHKALSNHGRRRDGRARAPTILRLN